ncbi:unnamed protein product [Vitrella brassicaformis CCMP3155]|uniref:Uncharacterized protein n=1 Tax=Vitrella brassicaformis (strain CCMP3155) TaxID=1169540 RepID=A0A0G4EYV8_VITBC|nr:unnamed protein product [Vitrella brassicaformis CCMP3155]|eukprot:CEM03640.1 unnamed protein product [Vitrella brassicaformis CCMP3155]
MSALDDQGTYLHFKPWQEALFGVFYVMDSSRKEATGDAIKMTARILNTFKAIVEFLQIVPMVLLNCGRVLNCRDYTLMSSAECIVVLVSSPFRFAAGDETFRYFSVVGGLALLMLMALGCVLLVAQTFRQREVHLIWPLVLLRGFVRIFVTTFYVSTIYLMMTTFSCPLLNYRILNLETTDLKQCYGYMHIAIMALSGISLMWLVPFAFFTALLYNKFDQFSLDPSCAAHGRVEALFLIVKTQVVACRVAVGCSPAPETLRFVIALNAVSLSAVFAYSVLQAPFFSNLGNRLRGGFLAILLALTLSAYSFGEGDLDVPSMWAISLAAFGFGTYVSLMRKHALNAAVRQTCRQMTDSLTTEMRMTVHQMIEEEDEEESPMSPHTPHATGAVTPKVSPGKRDSILSDVDVNMQMEVAKSKREFKSSSYFSSAKGLAKLLVFDCDIELLFRGVGDEWHEMSDSEKTVAGFVLETVFYYLSLNAESSRKALLYVWYASSLNMLLKNAYSSFKYVRLAHETASPFTLDVQYLCYCLQKDIENTRQLSYLGTKRKAGNLIDLVTYKKWANTAKQNHEKALHELMSFFKALHQSDKSGTAITAQNCKRELTKLSSALVAVRNAQNAYTTLMNRFPRSPEALESCSAFLYQVYGETRYTDMLDVGDSGRSAAGGGADTHSEGSSVSGVGSAIGKAGAGGPLGMQASIKAHVITSVDREKRRGLLWITVANVIGLTCILAVTTATTSSEFSRWTTSTTKWRRSSGPAKWQRIGWRWLSR